MSDLHAVGTPTPAPGTAGLHVLVGVDDQPASLAALRQAADLCRRLGAHLDVLHVVDVADRGDIVEADTKRQQDRVSRELAGVPLSWDFHVREGRPSEVLADMAEAVDAYCLVLGTRGEGVGAFLERLLRPSVSHAVIGRQHRPVLLVTDAGGRPAAD